MFLQQLKKLLSQSFLYEEAIKVCFLVIRKFPVGGIIHYFRNKISLPFERKLIFTEIISTYFPKVYMYL